MSSTPLVIGHRGASRDAPENTLGAFRLAFEQGADGIEADFRLTADGAIVCLHDDRTGRTATKDLEVRHSTVAELRALEPRRWQGTRWSGEWIPTLAEVLDELPAGKRIYIELKSGAEIVPELAAVLAASRVEPERVRFLSFSAPLIQLLKETLPGYRACWLTDYRWRGSWYPKPEQVLATLKRIGADGLASRGHKVLDARFVALLREAGMEVHVWTVDDPAGAGRFAALEVDAIMTNRPGWLRRLFSRTAISSGGER